MYNYYQENVIQVYEFSKVFEKPDGQHSQAVSGGFSQEIGAYKHPVPEIIQSCVIQGYLKINDNYPPSGVALIARELQQYSVLAVATAVSVEG